MNLLTRIKLAEIAYIQDQKEMVKQVNNLVSKNAETISVYIKRTDTEAFVCRYNDSAIIGFSGTESLIDLKQDLKFKSSFYKGGKLHAGFKEIFEQIDNPINKALNQLFSTTYIKKIDVIGHSLGGAIAIGAIDLIKIPYLYSQVTTFGCPNGWSKRLIKSFNDQYGIINYQNFCDYVPYLLGMCTGRPGYNVKIYGLPGHKISKYKKAIEKMN